MKVNLANISGIGFKGKLKQRHIMGFTGDDCDLSGDTLLNNG
jgi:flagellar basal body rod protein FlgF